MSILFKGNLEEGNYTLIKSTDGWVLKGETSYAGFNFADRPQEWIPSSKGEPSKAGWYLVTDGHRDVFFKWYSTLHGWEFADEDAILAWMPLPKPWKGADDE